MNRILLVSLTTLLLSGHGYCQGYVWFANFNQDLSILKPIEDPLTGDILDSRYAVQLFSGLEGASQWSLCPVDSATLFMNGEDVGLFSGGFLQIPGVPEGEVATLEVRIWTAIYPTWSQAALAARANYNVKVGRSGPFQMRTGSSESPAALVLEMPQLVVEMIPEPRTSFLFLLGFSGLSLLKSNLRFRKRKAW